MKISLSSSELLTQLQTASRVASTRSAVQALSGVMISAPAEGVARAARHRHGDRPAHAARRRGRAARRRGAARRACSSTWRARCRREQRDDGAAHRRAGRRADLRRRRRSTCGRCAPRTSRRCRSRRRSPACALPATAFVETITRVARSASRDETRPVLTGILISASGQELRMVATDSYRLSVKETALETPLAGQRSRRTFRPGRCRSSRGSSSRAAPRRSRSASGRTRRSSSSAGSCSPRG